MKGGHPGGDGLRGARRELGSQQRFEQKIWVVTDGD